MGGEGVSRCLCCLLGWTLFHISNAQDDDTRREDQARYCPYLPTGMQGSLGACLISWYRHVTACRKLRILHRFRHWNLLTETRSWLIDEAHVRLKCGIARM